MDMEDAELRWGECNSAVTAATLEIAELQKRGETRASSARLRELQSVLETAQRELEELQRDAGWTSDWR
jgi:hypothetical protein